MTNLDAQTIVPPATPETEKRGGCSVQRPCSALPRLYRGCWRPIKAGRMCRITRLFKGQPIVQCLGPLAGEANLRGDQYWRVRFRDGTEREIARAHLSLKLVVEHFVRKVTPNDQAHRSAPGGEVERNQEKQNE